MACLDTTALIDLAGKGGRTLRFRARSKVERLRAQGETLTTTRFNVAELWVGIERSSDRRAELESVETILRPLVVLDFEEDAARTFGRVVAFLQTRGEPIADLDALISSVALVHGESLVTRNPRHFSRVPGLTVEGY